MNCNFKKGQWNLYPDGMRQKDKERNVAPNLRFKHIKVAEQWVSFEDIVQKVLTVETRACMGVHRGSGIHHTSLPFNTRFTGRKKRKFQTDDVLVTLVISTQQLGAGRQHFPPRFHRPALPLTTVASALFNSTKTNVSHSLPDWQASIIKSKENGWNLSNWIILSFLTNHQNIMFPFSHISCSDSSGGWTRASGACPDALNGRADPGQSLNKAQPMVNEQGKRAERH